MDVDFVTSTAAVLASRSASPTIDNSTGNPQLGSIPRSRAVATSELLKSPGQFLMRLLLLLIMSSVPLNPGVLEGSYQPTESFSTFLRLATLETMTLPSGPTEFEPC